MFDSYFPFKINFNLEHSTVHFWTRLLSTIDLNQLWLGFDLTTTTTLCHKTWTSVFHITCSDGSEAISTICAVSDHQCGGPRVNGGFSKASIIPFRKIEALPVLRKNILGCKKYSNVKTLQRFQGKCISLSLALLAANLFIREMSHIIASADSNGRVSLTPALREELSYWQFLESWQDWLPWRDEKHVRLSLSTDASGFG